MATIVVTELEWHYLHFKGQGFIPTLRQLCHQTCHK